MSSVEKIEDVEFERKKKEGSFREFEQTKKQTKKQSSHLLIN